MALNALRSSRGRVVSIISSQRFNGTLSSTSRIVQCGKNASRGSLVSGFNFIAPSTSLQQQHVRRYGYYGPDKDPLDMNALQERVLRTVGKFEKIDAATMRSGPFYIQRRNFAGKLQLTYDLIQERVILVLQLYDKVDPNKLKVDSDFTKDLGLDSLDHVEVIMAIEDEFALEIPDVDAEKLNSPKDIIQYLADKEEAWNIAPEHIDEPEEVTRGEKKWPTE